MSTWLEHDTGFFETSTSEKGKDMHDDAKQVLGLLGRMLRQQVLDLDCFDGFIANEVLLHHCHGPACACHQTMKKQRSILKTQIGALLPTVEEFNTLADRAGLAPIDASRLVNSSQAALAE